MRAETDVVGIRLDDAASAVKVIGSSEAPGFPEPEPKDGSALPFVRFVNKSGDETLKLTRYRGADRGLVFLPKSAPWLADFEAELFAFPGAKA